ncbi:TPA: hypothetical protein N0F65_012235 [Lagenidium giganteum]|uniref:UTP23 sensor motif region domain-containing protein n=1 Tax=Lagenidium giganteum TaxID=4803 RepID=A0AAV2ZHU0_9STRA|nr:TPA: hypothetical protein N0F65_012235 [Lagenidium giganteum]
MRYLRSKAIRKALRQFHFLCGIKPPYKVLIDGNFIAMCLQVHVDLKERLPKFLQVKPHEVKFFIPEAAVKELELLGEAMAPAVALAKSFTVLSSDIDDEKTDGPVDVRKSIENIIGERNQGKYIVCTQEVELRKTLREVPGVPLVYLNRSVLVFEDISRATLAIVRQEEKVKMAKLDVNEKRKLESVYAENEDELDGGAKERLKKRRAKAPNPLSCKKPTKKKVRAKKNKQAASTH